MTTNSGQGKRPDPAEKYGGYAGYQPSNPADDPYGAYKPSGTAPQQSDPDYAYGQQSGQAQQQQSEQAQQQQQQQAYQPPESVQRRRSRKGAAGAAFAGTASAGTVDKQERRYALFSYLGLCFTGLFFWFTKSKSPYVRFHAAQSFFLFAPLLGVLFVINFLGVLTIIPILGGLLAFVLTAIKGLVSAAIAIMWIYMMYMAYRGVKVKLPIVGDYAERFSGGRAQP